MGDDRIAAIINWTQPQIVHDLRSFIGLLKFFRVFVEGFSHVAAPLTNLTRKRTGIHKWNDECTTAFNLLKEKLTSAPIIKALNLSKGFRCHTEASQGEVGGTLTQMGEDGRERAIAYFSEHLSPAEENNSANDRDLLAMVYFLKRFRCYLEGSTFELFTDNQLLENFLPNAC